MFKYGEEVVCIDDDLHVLPGEEHSEEGLEGLRKGEIYHIRWCGVIDPVFGKAHIAGWEPDTFYVRLMEIKRMFIAGEEAAYFSWRFQKPKKQEKKTDISVFKKMTKPKKKVLETV